MDFTTAINVIRHRTNDNEYLEPEVYDNLIDEARGVVYDDVADYLDGYDKEGLGDWLAEGSYDGNEDPQQLAEEWLRVTEQE